MPEGKPILVDFSEQNPTKRLLPHLPILSSRQAGWNGFLLEYHSQPAGEFPEIYFN